MEDQIMSASEENGPEYNWFYPILVGIPEGTPKINVQFSPFSVPKVNLLPGYRGIADVDFPESDDRNGEEVILRVFITKEEEEGKKNIRVFKKNRGWFSPDEENKWKRDFHEEEYGIMAGYLQTKIKVGDPPIAVG